MQPRYNESSVGQPPMNNGPIPIITPFISIQPPTSGAPSRTGSRLAPSETGRSRNGGAPPRSHTSEVMRAAEAQVHTLYLPVQFHVIDPPLCFLRTTLLARRRRLRPFEAAHRRSSSKPALPLVLLPGLAPGRLHAPGPERNRAPNGLWSLSRRVTPITLVHPPERPQRSPFPALPRAEASLICLCQQGLRRKCPVRELLRMPEALPVLSDLPLVVH